MTAADLLAAGAEAMVEAAFRTGEFDQAERTLEAARSRAAGDGNRATEAAALDRLAMTMHFRALDRGRDSAGADAEEALFQRALAIRREIGDQAGIAESLFGVGLVHQVLRGDRDAAMPCFLEALALAEAHADDLLRSEVHRHVGFFSMVKDVEPEKAVRHLRISLELRERVGDPRWIPSGLLALGQAELVAGRRPEAIEHLRQAVRRAREAGLRERRVQVAEEWLRRAEAGEPPTFD